MVAAYSRCSTSEDEEETIPLAQIVKDHDKESELQLPKKEKKNTTSRPRILTTAATTVVPQRPSTISFMVGLGILVFITACNRSFTFSSCSDDNTTSLLVSSSFLIPIEVAKKLPPSEELIMLNGQDRPNELYGTKRTGFVHVQDQTKKLRHEQMKYLQQVRTGTTGTDDDDEHKKYSCGPIHSGKNWRVASTSSQYGYYHNADEFIQRSYTMKNVTRYICEVPHPGKAERNDDIQIHIERIGPFMSTGNVDWSVFSNYNATGSYDYSIDGTGNDQLIMRDVLRTHKDIFIRGTFISLIDANGTFFMNYPPLHMHHAHLHPYADGTETSERIHPKRNGENGESTTTSGIVGGGSAYMDHHIVAQQHGDSVCHDPTTGQDDFSCLLHILPQGHGMHIRNSSGFRFDFEVNDVRTSSSSFGTDTMITGQYVGESPPPEPLEELEWYIEVAILWTSKPQIPVTYMHIAAPESGLGPATYAIPIDDSSTMIYYNYTHDWRDDIVGVEDDEDNDDERLAAGVNGVEGLGAGTISNLVGHVHHSMFDSLFVFKETNMSRNVFRAIDSIRPRGHYLPHIPECHNETPEEVKERAIQLALGPGRGELICEVTKPNLIWLETPSGKLPSADDVPSSSSLRGANQDDSSKDVNPMYMYRDRQMDLHCLENIRLEPGDTLTFLSFSRSRPTSTLGRIQPYSQGHKNAGIFEGGLFAQSEHTILRFDFVSDKARDSATAAAAAAEAAATNGRQDDSQPELSVRPTTVGHSSSSSSGSSSNFNLDYLDEIYTPPVLYLTQRWVHVAPDECCFNAAKGKQWYTYVNRGIPGCPDYEDMQNCTDMNMQQRLDSMMDHCPASITLDSNSKNRNPE